MVWVLENVEPHARDFQVNASYDHFNIYEHFTLCTFGWRIDVMQLWRAPESNVLWKWWTMNACGRNGTALATFERLASCAPPLEEQNQKKNGVRR